MRKLKRTTAASLAAIALGALVPGGCGLWNTLPAGTITGVVLYNGAPAPGRRVSILGADVAPRLTDLNGRYSFSGVNARQAVQVVFVSRSDIQGQVPNEVYQWQSLPVDVSSGGADLPAFDVSYDGLLYPDVAMALLASPSTPIPFHWSTQLSATHYRLHMQLGTSYNWVGPWGADPMAVFGQTITPGKYNWYVEFDGGGSGTGQSYTRDVDLSPPSASSGTSTGGGS